MSYSTLGDHEMGSVAFSRPKPPQVSSFLPNRIEVTVHKDFEQHATAQTNDHGSNNSANEQFHEKPNVWGLGDGSDVELGR
jgi:hypothetical protein